MAILKEHWVPLFVGGIGLILVIIGLAQFFTRSNTNEKIVFEEANSTQTESKIMVDVQGAVIKSGIYELKPDSRMVDALAKAGGLSEEADRLWVEKNINLAQKVTDGQKVYIPRAGESVQGQSSFGITAASTININNASVTDLESLPGIGEVTAQKIIDNRPYSSVEELISKKAVGNATYEKIKDLVSAN